MLFSIEKVDEIKEDVENEKNRELFMNPYKFNPPFSPSGSSLAQRPSEEIYQR